MHFDPALRRCRRFEPGQEICRAGRRKIGLHRFPYARRAESQFFPNADARRYRSDSRHAGGLPGRRPGKNLKVSNFHDDATRTAAKDAAREICDVFENTAKAGKLDGGAVLMLQPRSMAFAAGGFVQDAELALDRAFHKLADLEKENPKFPTSSSMPKSIRGYDSITFLRR